MRLRDRRSILAVDPTSRGLAYVAFEGGELLDWGHRRAGRDRRVVEAFLGELIRGYATDALVLEDPEGWGVRRRPRLKELLLALARHARREGVEVIAISRGDVRAAWAAIGVTTKEAMGAAIAEELPELGPYVPPRRKTWMSEHPHVNLFDAASLALHAFAPDDPVR
jgi:hypothetical protein